MKRKAVSMILAVTMVATMAVRMWRQQDQRPLTLPHRQMMQQQKRPQRQTQQTLRIPQMQQQTQ